MSAEEKHDKTYPYFADNDMLNKGSASQTSAGSSSEHDDVSFKTFYCTCRECRQYFAQGTPIQCIDPFLVEMKSRYSYKGHLYGKKEAVERREPDPDNTFKRPATPTRNINDGKSKNVKRKKRLH